MFARIAGISGDIETSPPDGGDRMEACGRDYVSIFSLVALLVASMTSDVVGGSKSRACFSTTP